MSNQRSVISAYTALTIIVLAGVFLSIYPIDPKFSALNPQWLCLIVIYWTLYGPFQFGVARAWGLGLAADIVFGSVWGSHAAALAVVSYFCLVTHQRVRHHPLWQQTLWVAVFITIYQTIVNWFEGLAGYAQLPKDCIINIIVSILAWPILFLFLQALKKRYRFY